MSVNIFSIKFCGVSRLLALGVCLCVWRPVSAQDSDTCTGVLPPRQSLVFGVESNEGLVTRAGEVRAGLLYDVDRNMVVWEKDMHYAYPIASLTKMMVALLAVEDVRSCVADWSDEVKVDRTYRASRRSRKVYKTTETYTLESLVQLAMIPSNNLACEDIAKHLGGTVDNFVQRMNNRAQALGMKNTFYSNPSGLPASVKDADNSASPHDLLLLAMELLRYKEILKITAIGYAEISNDKRKAVYRNHNHLVIDYENDVDGLKTGYTKRAKFCLVATSKKEGVRLISIVLGVDGPYLRNEIVADMLNGYYETLGCGPMIPTSGAPLARKKIVNDAPDASDNLTASADGKVTYKTMWVKEKRVHMVRSGETLSGIASRYGCTYHQIKKWNNLSGTRIYKGQRLYVYMSVPKKIAIPNPDVLDNEDESVTNDNDGAIQVTEPAAEPDSTNVPDADSVDQVVPEPQKVIATPAKKPATKKDTASVKKAPVHTVPAQKYLYHVVQPGDTLWGIAQRYDGITVDDLKRTNGISNSRALKPGTKLKIKVKAGS